MSYRWVLSIPPKDVETRVGGRARIGGTVVEGSKLSIQKSSRSGASSRPPAPEALEEAIRRRSFTGNRVPALKLIYRKRASEMCLPAGIFSQLQQARSRWSALYSRTDREPCPSIDPHDISDAYAELASILVRSSAERERPHPQTSSHPQTSFDLVGGRGVPGI